MFFEIQNGATALIFILTASLQILDLIFLFFTFLYTVGSHLNRLQRAEEYLFGQIQSMSQMSRFWRALSQ